LSAIGAVRSSCPVQLHKGKCPILLIDKVSLCKALNGLAAMGEKLIFKSILLDSAAGIA
jgi:hypothetical protein